MIRFVVALAVMVVATMVTDNCASPPRAPHAAQSSAMVGPR